MLAKLKRVLLAAAILIAGGLGIRAALRQASIDESFTCANWQTILDSIKERPEYVPLGQIIKQDCGSITFDVDCAEMPNGNVCRHGHRHKGTGTALTSNVPAGIVGAHHTLHTCDPALGTPIPCVSNQGKNWWKRVRDGTYDKRQLFRRIKRIIDAR